MAFRTLNALLPGYTVYLIPDHSAPCSSTLGGLSVGLQALQATPAALLLGMLFLQVVRTLPPSFHSVSTQMLSHRLLKHCPLFSSLLIPYLAYFFSSEHLSLSDACSRSRTICLFPPLNVSSMWAETVFSFPHYNPMPTTHNRWFIK